LNTLQENFEKYCGSNQNKNKDKGKIPANGLVMLAGSLSSPNPETIPYYI